MMSILKLCTCTLLNDCTSRCLLFAEEIERTVGRRWRRILYLTAVQGGCCVVRVLCAFIYARIIQNNTHKLRMHKSLYFGHFSHVFLTNIIYLTARPQTDAALFARCSSRLSCIPGIYAHTIFFAPSPPPSSSFSQPPPSLSLSDVHTHTKHKHNTHTGSTRGSIHVAAGINSQESAVFEPYYMN